MPVEIILKKEREDRKLVFTKTQEEKDILKKTKLEYRDHCRNKMPGWKKRVEGAKNGTMNM